MKSVIKTTLLATAVATSAFVSTQASAEVSANIGATSNYVWRGVTQSQDKGSFSAGLDYAHEKGFYAGTWAGSLGHDNAGNGGGTEVDLYAGYAGEKGKLGYDVGVISYMYPATATGKKHAEELTLSATYGIFEAGLALGLTNTMNKDDVYTYVGVSKELNNGVTLGATVGNTDFDAPGSTDYTHYQVSAGYKDFTLAVDDTDVTGSDAIVSLSWGKSFDM